MAADPPVSAVLIGAGMVARTHVAACLDSEAVALKGIFSRRAAPAQAIIDEVADRADLTLYPDIEAVASDDVDFAIVVTPPNARVALIGALVAAGKPVLLEKPVARSLAEAEEVVEICETAEVPLGIVFQHQMRAASVKAADLVAGGGLGDLGLVEITVPWWRDQAYYNEPGRGTYGRDGGGVLISQAIHTLDLALSLIGPVTEVQAMTATTAFHEMEAEDFATASLRFENGAVGSMVASTASFPGSAETIALHFERASLRLDSGVLTVSWRDGQVETFGETAGTGGRADPMAFTHTWHQGIIEDFAEAIRTGRAPVASGRDALAVHRLIDAIETSARSGRIEEVRA
ncbi:MAG: Gfo/Idh/MocA family oxidoreductase [Rhodobacteraceae bacterium]|nr:Gfo/Idh/MocA family oxidoreductase [Paracoccaceae bacterium]